MWLWLAPRNGLVGFLLVYRRVVSPLYGQVCRYHPSCSAYALGAIQYHGAVRGLGLGVWRILRCNPWARGGIDDPPEPKSVAVAITRAGFVRPNVEE